MKILTALLTAGAILVIIGVSSISVFSQENAPVEKAYKGYNGNEVARLIDRVSIETPYHYKNLTVFPLAVNTETDSRDYLTLDEGFRQSLLVVREVDEGEVNAVQLKNKSDRLIFGMSGEVVVGAKQDRMLENDILIPPHSGWLRVGVYCVEHGRWIATSPEFSSQGFAANPGLRQRAAETKNQSEVWNEVASSRADLGVGGATGALGRIYDNTDVQNQSKPYEEKLSGVPEASSRTIGVVVAVGDRIVCADIFASHQLFHKMWKKLLRSYVIDALRKRDEGAVTQTEVKDFLSNANDGRLLEHDTPGRGTLYEIKSDLADGSALVYTGSVVHFDLFPKIAATPLPEDDRSAPRLDIRRNERFRE